MNTIKFNSIYDMRKETSDVSNYSIKTIDINGVQYKYFSDTQICLYITKNCNANCKFCINKYNTNFTKCKNISEEEYLNKLEDYLDLFKDIKPYITITGGEPTNDPKLIPVIKLLKEKGYKIRTFATNGSGLLNKYNGKILMEYLKDIYINSINLSRMVYDEDMNAKLMEVNKDYLDNQKIAAIGRFSKANNMETRMSCIILKDGVNDLKSLLDYKNAYNRLGIDTIMFRELMHQDNYKYQDMKVDIENIFEEIEKSKDFIYQKTLEGMYYIVKIYRYKDELVKCYKEKTKKNSDIIRDFFIYPDMTLLDGYNDKVLEVI